MSGGSLQYLYTKEIKYIAISAYTDGDYGFVQVENEFSKLQTGAAT